MNFSPPVHSDNITPEMVASLQNWWSMAGVDNDYEQEPASLLQEKIPPPVKPPMAMPTQAAATAQKPGDTIAGAPGAVTEQVYPKDHEAFLDWLQIPANLIERAFAQNFIQPVGALNPEIMIIAAQPERNASEVFPQYDPKSAALLINMLRATGTDSQGIYFASLSLARPISDQIDPQYLPALKKRILHQIELVQPKKLLLFGNALSNLFFDENLLTARKNKQIFNHVSSNIETVVTFHPQMLLQRPELKAEAWKDLQMLTRISAS